MGKVSVVSRGLQSVRIVYGSQQMSVVSGLGERSQQKFAVSEDDDR